MKSTDRDKQKSSLLSIRLKTSSSRQLCRTVSHDYALENTWWNLSYFSILKLLMETLAAYLHGHQISFLLKWMADFPMMLLRLGFVLWKEVISPLELCVLQWLSELASRGGWHPFFCCFTLFWHRLTGNNINFLGSRQQVSVSCVFNEGKCSKWSLIRTTYLTVEY